MPLRETSEVVSVKVIVEQLTSKSRGFGFIEMSNSEEGLKPSRHWILEISVAGA